MKCDFCSNEPVVARYHANDFVVEAFSVPELDQGSKGDWAACIDCEGLIDNNQWDRLVTRVIALLLDSYPFMKPAIDPMMMKERLYDMYAQLLTNDFKKVPL